LGLSTVYGIVTQSRGHILVHSEPGRGTRFDIYLPKVEGSPVSAAEEEETASRSTDGNEKVLLVEDDVAVRELSREILEMHGYEVIEADNGQAALKICEDCGAELDLVVTDLIMPQMGGRDLALRIAPMLPEVKLLFLSGYTDDVLLNQGQLDPGSFFLQKPFTPAALARKVREVLDA
jgi:CheY-like chemotaxis protein